jgi:hypothetical protein
MDGIRIFKARKSWVVLASPETLASWIAHLPAPHRLLLAIFGWPREARKGTYTVPFTPGGPEENLGLFAGEAR